jgi:16S rRNA (guanine527-N7)-methyltransferase
VTPVPESELRRLLEEAVARLAFMLSEEQMQQLAVYFGLLLRWNEKINLTSIRRPDEMAVRHFEESLFLIKALDETGAQAQRPTSRSDVQTLLVDVGSGAGFPALPLKIAKPHWHVVLLEPTIKKIAFLKEVIRHCVLEGVEARAERLEEAARGDLAGRAALVTLRAVAITPLMLSDLKRLLAPEGCLALFLGERDAQRLQASGASAAYEPEYVRWESSVPIPRSERRVILLGRLRSGANGV